MADNDFDRQTRREDTGTRIHVEKDRKPNWLWLLVPLILGLLVLPNFFNRDDNREATNVEQREQVAGVTYDGRRYQPAGEARNMDVNSMVLVGQAENGQDIYGIREVAGGGGGGDEATVQLFTKTASGLFQPLSQVD
ncbi:MAG: hypothetical protein ACK46X_01635 [Candidatus Sericytochromatia bacterium]